jgi:hypothetical protein
MSGWKKVNVRGKITHSPHFNSQAISGDLAITNTVMTTLLEHIAATDDLKGYAELVAIGHPLTVLSAQTGMNCGRPSSSVWRRT